MTPLFNRKHIMIDEETRQRAKEYADSFAEATADDPKTPAPDLEPMEEPVQVAPKAEESDDSKVFAEAFNAVETNPVTMANIEAKPLEAAKPATKETFAQAWKRNRDAGNKTFEWEGKPGVKFSTENKAEKAARKSEMKPVVKVQTVSVESQMPAPLSDKTVGPAVNKAKTDKDIYANSFLTQAVDSIKAKLDDKSQVGKAKTLPNGKPNLTAQ